ncbi:MAG: RDD family protein [Bacillota bacterium]
MPSLLVFIITVSIIVSLIIKRKREKVNGFTSYYQTVSGMRIISSFIDWLIVLIIIFLIEKSLSVISDIDGLYIELLRIVVIYSFTTFLIVKYGGTPGKLLLGIKIIDINGKYLTTGKAILRQVFSLILEIIAIYIIFVAAYAIKYNTIGDPGYIIAKTMILYIPILLFMPIYLLDYIFILFSNKNRAIHDYLADSIVIYKGKVNYLKQTSIESSLSEGIIRASGKIKEIYSFNSTFKVVISPKGAGQFQIDLFMWEDDSWVPHPGQPLLGESMEAAERIAKEYLDECSAAQFKKDSNFSG